jgi:hypothetical protein
MSFPLGASLYTVGFGTRPENVEVPVLQTRAPTSSDISYPIGKRWVDQTGNGTYTLTSFSTFNGVTTANWQADSGTGSGVLTINSNAPVANNYIIAGTANQSTVTQTAGTSTISTPATFIAPGSIAATTTLTATLGAITATNGNFVKGTAGNKDVYSSVGTTTAAGANSAGTVTLVGGTATVATTAVTASSLIRLYRQGIGATGAAALGIVTLGTITAGTSFVINSVQAANATALQASDVSVVFWEIVN